MGNLISEIQEKGQMVNDLLDKFDLYWNVLKKPLYTGDGEPSEYFSVRREDNGNEFMSCKEGYEILQNWELTDLVVEVAHKLGADVEKGGSIQGGAKVFMQINSGALKNIGVNNDQVDKYITFMNSHDGSSGVGMGMTNVTVSCSNTFYTAYRQMENKIRHTQTMRERIDTVMYSMDKYLVAEKSLYDTFIKMSEVEVQKDDILNIVRNITKVDLNVSQEEAKEKYSTNAMNKTSKLMTAIASETQQKGNTLWGLFSGVTNYTTHSVQTKSKDLMENKLVGQGGKADNVAYKLLSQLVY